MNRNPRLELNWIGKENRPKLEPRILLEEPEKSHHTKHRVTDGDILDNRLIYCDKPVDKSENEWGRYIFGKQFWLISGECDEPFSRP